MRGVVALVIDGVAMRYLSSGSHPLIRRSTFVLPLQSGREELTERCFELLLGGVPQDYSRTLLELIRENSDRAGAFSSWREGFARLKGTRLTEWISFGLYLEVLDQLDDLEAQVVVRESRDEVGKRLAMLLTGGALPDALDEAHLAEIMSWSLSREEMWGYEAWGEEALGQIGRAVSPMAFSVVFRWGGGDRLLSEFWHGNFPRIRGAKDGVVTALPNTELAERCRRFGSVGQELAATHSVRRWRTELGPWNRLVETGRHELGDCWMLQVFAFVASGVKTGREQCVNARELLTTKRTSAEEQDMRG